MFKQDFHNLSFPIYASKNPLFVPTIEHFIFIDLFHFLACFQSNVFFSNGILSVTFDKRPGNT